MSPTLVINGSDCHLSSKTRVFGGTTFTVLAPSNETKKYLLLYKPQVKCRTCFGAGLYMYVSPAFDNVPVKRIVRVGMKMPDATWDNVPVCMKMSAKFILNSW